MYNNVYSQRDDSFFFSSFGDRIQFKLLYRILSDEMRRNCLLDFDAKQDTSPAKKWWRILNKYDGINKKLGAGQVIRMSPTYVFMCV